MGNKLNDNDAIITYLLGEQDKLSKPQQAKLERLYVCDDLIRQYGGRNKVVKLMVSRYRHEYGKIGKTYSQRTAASDYEATQVVFGTTAKHNREYHVDLLLEQIQETRRAAQLTNNTAVMAQCDKHKAMVLEKFLGDKDVPDYKEIQIPDQIFRSAPELLEGSKKVDEKTLEKELAKLVEKPKKDGLTIDVEHKEMKE